MRDGGAATEQQGGSGAKRVWRSSGARASNSKQGAGDS